MPQQDRDASLEWLRNAAKQGFDAIDQGCGIVLKGKKALAEFFEQIVAEVAAKPTRGAGRRGDD